MENERCFELEKARQFAKVCVACLDKQLMVDVKRAVDDDITRNRLSIDKFSNPKVLGSGIYGRVVKAEFEGTEVALKMLDINRVDNLLGTNPPAEVEMLKMVKGRRAFVQMLGVFVDETPVIVTELAIADLFLCAPIPPRFAFRLGYQLLDGLAFLESRRIVHNDIKPSNLLVNDKANLRIADFGMAVCLKEGEEQLKYSLSDLGTSGYRHFESLCRGHYSYGTDMFSAGLSLYEMITDDCLMKPLVKLPRWKLESVKNNEYKTAFRYGRLTQIKGNVGVRQPFESIIERNVKPDSIAALINEMTMFKEHCSLSRIPLASSLLESDVLKNAMADNEFKLTNIWEDERVQFLDQEVGQLLTLNQFPTVKPDSLTSCRHMLRLSKVLYYAEEQKPECQQGEAAAVVNTTEKLT